MKIEQIHDSLINGQREQMVEQVEEYGVYTFWSDYRDYLHMMYDHHKNYALEYFTDATISYFRIKGR